MILRVRHGRGLLHPLADGRELLGRVPAVHTLHHGDRRLRETGVPVGDRARRRAHDQKAAARDHRHEADRAGSAAVVHRLTGRESAPWLLQVPGEVVEPRSPARRHPDQRLDACRPIRHDGRPVPGADDLDPGRRRDRCARLPRSGSPSKSRIPRGERAMPPGPPPPLPTHRASLARSRTGPRGEGQAPARTRR